jgi:hypothetical protein
MKSLKPCSQPRTIDFDLLSRSTDQYLHTQFRTLFLAWLRISLIILLFIKTGWHDTISFLLVDLIFSDCVFANGNSNHHSTVINQIRERHVLCSIFYLKY